MAKTSFKMLALLGGLAVGVAAPAFAQDSGPLIDKLVKKGILTDQEGEDLRADLQKDFGTSSAGKLNLSSALTEFKIGGDARVRYEQRGGSNAANGDEGSRSRFRDRLRLALSGKMQDGWFFGTRLETGTGNRSTNNTMGDTTNSPFAKGGNSALQVGQVYIGRNWDDYTFTAGRFAAPQVTTPMLWDDDINPEGFAEQWKHESGNVTWIASAGQYVYDNRSTTNAIGAGGAGTDTFMFVEQFGAKYKFSATKSIQVLPTLYSYTGNTGDFTPATTTNNAALRTSGLTVVDIPVEYSFSLFNLPAKVWVDAAMNLDSSERCQAAGFASAKGDNKAYQVGFGLGQTKAKGDWEARAFYQSVEAFALDPNLVDSDLFDSRTNMQGYGLSLAYVVANGVTTKITYASATRLNDNLATYGAGDISTANLADYNLLQLDLSVKF